MLKKIKKMLKGKKFPLYYEDIANIINSLELEGVINFAVIEDVSADSYAIRTVYFSNKIGKLIIFSNTFYHEIETIEELVEIIETEQKEIVEFEKKLK